MEFRARGHWGLFIVFLLLGVSMLRGQTKQLLKADEFYESGGYYDALTLYKDNLITLPKEQLGDYLFKVAECYRRTGNSRQAELWYSKAIMRNCSDARARRYHADALLSEEKYDLAREEYEAYLALVPNDPLATAGLRSVELSKQWKETPSGYIVKGMSVVNTRSNDYGPMYASGDYRTLVFASCRDGASGSQRHSATGQKFSDLFVTTSNSDGKWSKPRSYSSAVNTVAEEGTPSYNGDYSRMWYTRCRVIKKEKQGCQIMEVPQVRLEWGTSQALEVAPDSMVVAHPSVSADGLTLYFTSNISGGFGGLDLWKLTRNSESDSWGDPVNLGSEINTSGDEVFPFSHPDGSLYFSSNGHPGMGGLDIFRYYKDGSGKMQLENMRYPINSSADDFGITIQKKREEGFFTSNRKGGKGGDDIYWFYLPPLEFNLVGQIADVETGVAVEGARIRVVGSDGSIQTGETNAEGKFKFMLTPNTDYVAISNSKGFLNGKMKVSTRGKTTSEDIETRITMKSYAESKPIVLPNIFYDFNSWELRPESQESLNFLAEILRDNASIVIELGAHTDSKGSSEYNHELSQRRAQSVVNYLIEHEIPADRLRAKGYASSEPFVVDEALHNRYPNLPLGERLTDEFISTLESELDREAAAQANRRTEFRVIRDDYPAP